MTWTGFFVLVAAVYVGHELYERAVARRLRWPKDN